MNSSLKRVFRGKKIFLTGHTGFKGCWLNLILQNLGADVKGYSLKPEKGASLFEKVARHLECKSVIADIRDSKRLAKEILDFRPDFVFHLAAQSLVRRSYRLPLYTFETNIIGTANLLNALTELNKKCTTVVVTTDKVYENKEWVFPYRENDRLGGRDPYSASKSCAEIVTASYVNSFFSKEKYSDHKKSISAARAGNVIGGGDYSEDRLIPDIVKAFLKGRTAVIRNPESVRPWQYVLEPLYGYLRLAALTSADPGKYQGEYNFGPDASDVLSVRDIVKIAHDFFPKGKFSFPSLRNQPHEAGILKLDISKARDVLGWNPVMNAEEAVKKTMKWYRESAVKGADIFSLCMKEISEFESAR